MPTGGAGWSASHRGVRASGTAKSFDAARTTFEAAWQCRRPNVTEADFTEYRRHRALDAWKRAM
jgi:hypothetical protein